MRRVRLDDDAGVERLVGELRPTGGDGGRTAETVRGIVAAVRARGDDALLELTRRFDWAGAPDLAPRGTPDAALAGPLAVAIDNVRRFHAAEAPARVRVVQPAGQVVERRPLAVRRAGVYAPGGGASLASSVVMGVVPAQVAGVGEICVCTPPGPDGQIGGGVLAACAALGVTEVHAVGGAQAIAAMAYGTETIRRCDVVVGPGNAFVTEAKRQVAGDVGIDGLAGPSEVLVVSDGTVDAGFLALDLLAQSEHGPGSAAILVGEDAAELDRVAAAIGERSDDVALLGRITLVAAPGRLARAVADAYAAEHLQLNVAPEALARWLDDPPLAGAIFCGPNGATPFGDYVAGSNHVLPTGGRARFGAGLSVETFVRGVAVVDVTDESLPALVPALEALARSEGLPFHAAAARARLEAVSGRRAPVEAAGVAG